MPWGNGKIVQVKPLAAVDIATEADVLAAPSTTTKGWRVVGGLLGADQAGLYDFQESGSTTSLFQCYLEANKNPVLLHVGNDGVKVTANTALQCDGPGSSHLSGCLFVVEE